MDKEKFYKLVESEFEGLEDYTGDDNRREATLSRGMFESVATVFLKTGIEAAQTIVGDYVKQIIEVVDKDTHKDLHYSYELIGRLEGATEILKALNNKIKDYD